MKHLDLFSDIGNYFRMTGIQFHEGNQAQPFVPEDYGTLLNKVMRYQVVFNAANIDRTLPSAVNNGGITRVLLPTKVPLMRANSPNSTYLAFLQISGTRGTDWKLRNESDSDNTTGTIDATVTNSTMSPFIRFQNGTYTAGQPMHIIMLTSQAKIRLNAEIY